LRLEALMGYQTPLPYFFQAIFLGIFFIGTIELFTQWIFLDGLGYRPYTSVMRVTHLSISQAVNHFIQLAFGLRKEYRDPMIVWLNI